MNPILRRLLLLSQGIVKNALVMYLDGKDFTNIPPTNPWLDKSGLGNNAVPSGFAYTSASGSNGNDGVVFDGVNDNGDCGVNTSLNIIGNITLEALVSSTNVTATQVILAKSNATFTGTQYELVIGGGKVSFLITNGSAIFTVSGFELVNNTLYHLVATFNNNVLSVYANGVKSVDTATLTGTQSTTPVSTTIGKRNHVTSPQYLGGTIKMARIYNRALSNAEILQNYNASR